MNNTENIINAIVTAFVILLIASAVYFKKTQCSAKAQKMGFECDWGFVQGCMIKVNEKWMPMNSYRVIE